MSNAISQPDGGPVRRWQVDSLWVELYPDQDSLSRAVTEAVKKTIHEKLAQEDFISGILATGNSQVRFLDRLILDGGVDWSRLVLFHMDEYLGISADHPASFRRYMREKVEEKITPRKFHYLQGDCPEPLLECERYAKLLNARPLHFCCLGIGENGHLAFNDPPVANFADPSPVKLVRLDPSCKQQQVDEGHFPDLDSVPAYAITLTIPTLFLAQKIFCIAPETRKAHAIKQALEGPISESCPASFLRTRSNATLYLDVESASELKID